MPYIILKNISDPFLMLDTYMYVTSQLLKYYYISLRRVYCWWSTSYMYSSAEAYGSSSNILRSI